MCIRHSLWPWPLLWPCVVTVEHHNVMRCHHAVVSWCQTKVWGSSLGSPDKPTLSRCSGLLELAAPVCPRWRARRAASLVSSLQHKASSIIPPRKNYDLVFLYMSTGFPQTTALASPGRVWGAQGTLESCLWGWVTFAPVASAQLLSSTNSRIQMADTEAPASEQSNQVHKNPVCFAATGNMPLTCSWWDLAH